MSSYMLSNEEFQMITDWLYNEATSKISRHAFCIKTFIGFEPGTDEHHHATPQQIKERLCKVVRLFYDLNRLALTTAYGDEYSRDDETEFLPKFNPYLKERKVIETLQSLRYQCAEYIISETSYMKELKKFIGKLCENIFDRGSD